MTTADARRIVEGAKLAEDAFPGVVSGASLQAAFRELALLLHPDRAGAASEALMARLNALRDEAERKLAAGTWGKRAPADGLQVQAKNTYRDVLPLAAGDTCDVYEADYKDAGMPRVAAIKLVKEPRDADLSAAEWRVLGELWAKTDDAAKGFQRYLPRPVETARIEVGGKVRRANVFRLADHRLTLAEVMKCFPGGLDPRDAAWMWRRVLEIASWVGLQGYVHGALIPDHVLVDPEDHSAVLVGWSGAVKAGQKVPVMSARAADWYAPEVPGKLPATPAADVYGAARLALGLVGDRSRMPAKMAALLDACLIRNPRARHGDAIEVYRRLDAVLRAEYGPPKFRRLEIPGAR